MMSPGMRNRRKRDSQVRKDCIHAGESQKYRNGPNTYPARFRKLTETRLSEKEAERQRFEIGI